MPKPSQKVISPKVEKEKKPAQTVEDWENEEAQDEAAPSKRSGDFVNDFVGDTVFMSNHSEDTWRAGTVGSFKVSRYYLYKKLIVDYPRTELEIAFKRQFFKNIDTDYVWVAPGEELTKAKFNQRLAEARKGRKP